MIYNKRRENNKTERKEEQTKNRQRDRKEENVWENSNVDELKEAKLMKVHAKRKLWKKISEESNCTEALNGEKERQRELKNRITQPYGQGFCQDFQFRRCKA